LLEHEFGDEDCVRVARLPPGQIAPMLAIPAQKSALEKAGLFR